MKNIAIIPARSGSKGLKDKNIKNLNGTPLLAYSIDAAKESNLFDEIMISTDSEEYASIGSLITFLPLNKKTINITKINVNKLGVKNVPIRLTSLPGFKHNHNTIAKKINV